MKVNEPVNTTVRFTPQRIDAQTADKSAGERMGEAGVEKQLHRQIEPSISYDSTLIADAQDDLSNMSDVDMALVESIRSELQDGSFKLSPSDLAASILEFHRGES